MVVIYLNNVMSCVLIISILESFIHHKPARPCRMLVNKCVREQARGNITVGYFPNKRANISLTYQF